MGVRCMTSHPKTVEQYFFTLQRWLSKHLVILLALNKSLLLWKIQIPVPGNSVPETHNLKMRKSNHMGISWEQADNKLVPDWACHHMLTSGNHMQTCTQSRVEYLHYYAVTLYFRLFKTHLICDKNATQLDLIDF